MNIVHNIVNSSVSLDYNQNLGDISKIQRLCHLNIVLQLVSDSIGPRSVRNDEVSSGSMEDLVFFSETVLR